MIRMDQRIFILFAYIYLCTISKFFDESFRFLSFIKKKKINENKLTILKYIMKSVSILKYM